MSSFEMIAFGFAGVILLGAIILMLPISSSAGVVTPFDKTLFTATSAVCVTGLVVVDTGSYFTDKFRHINSPLFLLLSFYLWNCIL